MMSLTDLQIKRLKAPDRGQKTYFDDAVKGFGLRVSQGGTKTFVVLLGKKRKRRTIGRYPDMPLAEARAIAKRAQSDFLLEGPTAFVEKPKTSFVAARERFLEDRERHNKPSTAAEYRRLLMRHFSFSKDLAALTRHDITVALDDAANAPSEQKHAFVAIRTMMNWCVKRGLIDTSPVPPLSFKVTTRDRMLSDEELEIIWHRAAEVRYPFGRIIQLLILTGQRRGEIAGLQYGWINKREITFPSGFTKNKREHVIPIGQMVVDLIESLPKGGELLFPARGRESTSFNGWSKSKRSFDKTLEIEPYTLHDIRRTYSSTMARLGVPIYVTERLLNHVSGTISGVAAVYNRHSYRDEMREAVAAYEVHLAKLFAT